MYNKGLQGLKALDETLATMRKEALHVSRASPQDVQRFMLREDVRRQNAAQQQFQSRAGEDGPGAKCVGVDGRPLPSWYDGDFDTEDLSTSSVADEVAQRVAQAEQTLYPTLVGAVAGYELDEEPDTAVVERDANGAPLRILTIRSPDRSCVASRQCTTGSVAQDSGTESPPREVNPKSISFDKVYEYTPGEDRLKSDLFLARPPQCPSRQSKAKPQTLPTRVHGARAPLLSTEGCAVAESSAGGMIRGIRRDVLARRGEQSNNANDKASASKTQGKYRMSVLCEVSNAPIDSIPDISFARIVKSVTAFFCPVCGTCTARDLVTSMPDTCPACNEAFDKLPYIDKECPTHARVETPPPEPMRETSASSGRKKTVTSATGTDPVPCAKRDETESRNAETQAGAEVPNVLKNFAQLTDGMYFLHLWDQAMGQCESS